jgi:hypothetical protein
VSVAAARVAGLALAATVTATITTAIGVTTIRRIRAATSDVTDLTALIDPVSYVQSGWSVSSYLIALLRSALATNGAAAAALGAVTANMAGLTASVASLVVLRAFRALTAWKDTLARNPT